MGKGKDFCNELDGAALYKKEVQDIAVGDTVILRSGGPDMRVLEILGGVALCEWCAGMGLFFLVTIEKQSTVREETAKLKSAM